MVEVVVIMELLHLVMVEQEETLEGKQGKLEVNSLVAGLVVPVDLLEEVLELKDQMEHFLLAAAEEEEVEELLKQVIREILELQLQVIQEILELQIQVKQGNLRRHQQHLMLL